MNRFQERLCVTPFGLWTEMELVIGIVLEGGKASLANSIFATNLPLSRYVRIGE